MSQDGSTLVALPIIATDEEPVLAITAHGLREDKRARSSRAMSRSLSNLDDRQLLASFMEANDQLGARDILRLQLLPRNGRHVIVDLLRQSAIETD